MREDVQFSGNIYAHLKFTVYGRKHTHTSCNAVPLVWGLLRLAPINTIDTDTTDTDTTDTDTTDTDTADIDITDADTPDIDTTDIDIDTQFLYISLVDDWQPWLGNSTVRGKRTLINFPELLPQW